VKRTSKRVSTPAADHVFAAYRARMTIRVVMPRTIPCAQANSVMWRAWQRGYSSRAVMSVTLPGWMAVEFLVEVDSEALELAAFEIELDDALGTFTVRRGLRTTPLEFSGTGVWTEED
jgi:hypothetical protein